MRGFAVCAYVVFAAAFFGPVVGFVLQAWPFEPGSLQWRVGFAGLLAEVLMLPALALFGVLWVSRASGHVLGVATFAATSIFLATLITITALAYASDFFAMRTQVLPEGIALFDSVGVSNAIGLALLWIVFLTFAWNGVAAVREEWRGGGDRGRVPLLPSR
jgi:hypothetical protein